MHSRSLAVISLLFFLAQNSLGGPQFTPAEISERPKWEDFLETARVVDFKQLGGEDAVTNPWKLTLEKDGIRRYALWKDVLGALQGYRESWLHEVAAYRMDKLLGLNMVPPTVERTYKSVKGSCQLWVEGVTGLKEKVEKKIAVPKDKLISWNRAVYLQRTFDNLIANEDRNQNDILITEDWRIYLIDHSRTFLTTKHFTQKLLFSEKSEGGPKLMRELPRAFVEKIRSLDHQRIKDAVGIYLSDKEIEAVLTRRALVLQEIDKLIAENGEANVLY